MSSLLGITNARARIIFDCLRKQKLIKSRAGRAGTVLSYDGSKLLSKLNKYVRINFNSFIFSLPSSLQFEGDVSVILLNSLSEINNGIEERDIAVRSGADGAVTLIFDNYWYIPPKIAYKNQEESNISFSSININILQKYNKIFLTFGDKKYTLIAGVNIVCSHIENELRDIINFL